MCSSDLALEVNPLEVIVVTGAYADKIRSRVPCSRVKWVLNIRWLTGLGSSIAAGASAVNPEARAIMILLCDQYRVTSDDLNDLIDAWKSDTNKMVSASCDGQAMPPVIFPSDCIKDLRQLSDQAGAQSVLRSQPERVRHVNMEHAAFDIDYPEQLQALKNSSAD